MMLRCWFASSRPSLRRRSRRSTTPLSQASRPPIVASTCKALAAVHRTLGNRTSALQFLKRSLETGERMEAPDIFVSAQWQMASPQLEDGHAAEALDLAERAGYELGRAFAVDSFRNAAPRTKYFNQVFLL